MKSIFTSLCLCAVVQSFAQQKLASPEEFLGYEQGQQYTNHQKVLEYFKHVDDAIDYVEVKNYGTTYEGRPLVYAVISSRENISNLETIRANNLKKAGFNQSGASANPPAIVWLSYNVHGNEASSTEVAMLTLHSLANPQHTAIQQWLKNVVVIIDPCLNPDGRERFVNFNRQYGNLDANSNPDALEHNEPWPTGRSNHYLFDLNRDWAWLTQRESQARVKLYNEWMPQVHVDFHEQRQNSSYYFAPAAEPFHELISPWQREFQTQIGRNHAKYFDEQGWLYFTKEIYDLYYPGYGDTYPSLNGAIGMTYEQAGIGSGVSVLTDTGAKLTLSDRISHHNTTALSTIEISAKNASKLVEEFEKYFQENLQSPKGSYKTYVIKADNNRDKLKKFTTWLDNQRIEYGHPSTAKATKGFDFQNQVAGNVNVSTDDIVINIHQPKSKFITSVFEPVSKLPDSLTYDVTAWNLIYAYDLKAFAVNERINPSKQIIHKANDYKSLAPKPYAYIFHYQHLNDATLLAALLKENIRVRCAEKSFSVGTETFSPGTLVIPRSNNDHIIFFDSLVISLARKLDRKVFTTATGFVDKGKDLGSTDLQVIKAPSVGLLFGPATSQLSAGEVWHFFEQQIQYPVTLLHSENFSSLEFSKYQVLIVPDGYYSMFDDLLLEKLSSWVNSGGRLILISHAISSFADRSIFAIKRYATDEEKAEADKLEKEQKEKEGVPRYEETERKYISDYIWGAIYKASTDNSHPLAFGLGRNYFTLKTSELRFGYLNSGWNAGILPKNTKPIQGFAGYKANKSMSKSLVFGIQSSGAGEVVYFVDNPLFRSFWENGKMLFANAVFMVGNSR